MIRTKKQSRILAALFFVSSTIWCADDQRLDVRVHPNSNDEFASPLLADRASNGSPRAQRMIDEGESSCLKRGCRCCARCTCLAASATVGLGAGFAAGAVVGATGRAVYEIFACMYYCHKWCDKICPPENP